MLGGSAFIHPRFLGDIVSHTPKTGALHPDSWHFGLFTQGVISPASEWIFIQIFAGEKIMVSNGSLGSKEWYFTRYRALFCGSSPHIVGWLKKIDDFIAVRIQYSADDNWRNFHCIAMIIFSTNLSWCELFKNHHVYPKMLLKNGQKRDLQRIFYFFR